MAKPETHKYVERAAEVEAIQVDEWNIKQVATWLKTLTDTRAEVLDEGPHLLVVSAADGDRGAAYGDWVIRHDDGTISTLPEKDFAEKYETTTS